MCVLPVFMSVQKMCAAPLLRQKRVLDPLKLELLLAIMGVTGRHL